MPKVTQTIARNLKTLTSGNIVVQIEHAPCQKDVTTFMDIRKVGEKASEPVLEKIRKTTKLYNVSPGEFRSQRHTFVGKKRLNDVLHFQLLPPSKAGDEWVVVNPTKNIVARVIKRLTSDGTKEIVVQKGGDVTRVRHELQNGVIRDFHDGQLFENGKPVPMFSTLG